MPGLTSDQDSSSSVCHVGSDTVVRSLAGTITFESKERLFENDLTSDLSPFSKVGEAENPQHDLEPPNESFCAVHLQLLDSFVILRERAEKWASSCADDPDATWQAFVRLAVVRFSHWFHSATLAAIETSLPPLDVLMVWHSFMLNPSTYVRYCKVARSDSGGLTGISWRAVHSAIDPYTEDFRLSSIDIKYINSLGLHPDLLGFLESNYNSCTGVKELLSSHNEQLGGDFKLQALVHGFQELSMTNFTYAKYGINFDLAAAVHRQAAFAQKMSQFGWLHSPTLGYTLKQAIKRYRNFFLLIAESQESVVPVLDVDLIWHTHQLSPTRYTKFCEVATEGGFINHNDQVEEGFLDTGFKNTQRLYRDRFGEEYSRCHSWYCEAARHTLSNGLSAKEMTKIQELVNLKRERKKQLGLQMMLELAECDCYNPRIGTTSGSIQGADCAECGSNCGSRCSKAGCSKCNSDL